jgi:uncharacterized protein involved in cysteine biosynthesis
MRRIKDVFLGLSFVGKGFSMLMRTPRLWPAAIIPFVISIFLLAAMIWSFVHFYSGIYDWLVGHMGHIGIQNPDSWYMYILAALLWVVNVIFQLFVILMSLTIILVASYGIGLIVASPFNDALSERVETILTGIGPPPFSFKKFVVDTIRIVKIESLKGAMLISIPLVLLIVNFIPAIGGPIYIVATSAFGAWALGFSYADIPMGRRAIAFKERIAFGKRHGWALAGFGAPFIIPFFSLIFSPALVVGGTMLYVDRKKIEGEMADAA